MKQSLPLVLLPIAAIIISVIALLCILSGVFNAKYDNYGYQKPNFLGGIMEKIRGTGEWRKVWISPGGFGSYFSECFYTYPSKGGRLTVWITPKGSINIVYNIDSQSEYSMWITEENRKECITGGLRFDATSYLNRLPERIKKDSKMKYFLP